MFSSKCLLSLSLLFLLNSFLFSNQIDFSTDLTREDVQMLIDAIHTINNPLIEQAIDDLEMIDDLTAKITGDTWEVTKEESGYAVHYDKFDLLPYSDMRILGLKTISGTEKNTTNGTDKTTLDFELFDGSLYQSVFIIVENNYSEEVVDFHIQINGNDYSHFTNIFQ